MLKFCLGRILLSVKSHSFTHTQSSFSVSKRNYYSRQYRSSSFDNQNHQYEDYDKEQQASSNQDSPYAGMTLGAALALFAMTTDKVKAEGENYFEIDYDSPS